MASKEFLRKFMKERFPHDREGESYWNEWEERLMEGDKKAYG